MRNIILRSSPLAFALLLGCNGESALESGMIEKITSDGTRILRSNEGPLTAPSAGDPVAISTDMLVGSDMFAAVGELTVASLSGGRDGVTHVKLGQTAAGLRVHGAYAKVSVSERGEVLQVIDRLAPETRAVLAARVTERDALHVAMAKLGYAGSPREARVRGNTTDFEATAEMEREPTVERVAFEGEGGELRAGYLVETWSRAGNQLDHTLVGGDGEIVAIERRTNNDRYKVFPEDPQKGPQTVVEGPADGDVLSPAGWLGRGVQSSTFIRGNNTATYIDATGTDTPEDGGTPVADGRFLADIESGSQPTEADNKAVAVQNLFYLNNVLHDRLYRHGFDEAHGNFQSDNFGRGGAGGDPVRAEAQDGSGINNASMATPPDGTSPRMQMFLWSGKPDSLIDVGGARYGAYSSAFGAATSLAGVSGALAVYDDGAGEGSDACEPTKQSLAGKIVLLDRGTCPFTDKVLHAQEAGAVAVIIANNVEKRPSAAGGTEQKVQIPSVMVSKADGAALEALAGQSASMRKDPTPSILVDGDLDSDIVFHEYGHGLTWRMIGGMDGPLAGAIGEGASDVLAFLMNGDDRIGEYAFRDPRGIRRHPYTNYPLTYSDVDGAEVHADGEIYAAAMWRVLQNYAQAGLTADDLMGDFVAGMSYTPATPAYEDMRDGMLQAVAGTGRECLIWDGFARTGIGEGAEGRVRWDGSVTIKESFTVPDGCR